ncbi:MAG: hypothetical protein EBU84_03840, partial [Actinobacteria bacterium]|nr:hypothetical protein [Actinomycetota bacterium]
MAPRCESRKWTSPNNQVVSRETFNMTAARVIQKIWLSSKTYKLRTERTQSRIRAGQCFSVGTSDLGINREYSMYSGASDNHLDFLIRKIDDGIVSSRLAQCQEG